MTMAFAAVPSLGSDASKYICFRKKNKIQSWYFTCHYRQIFDAVTTLQQGDCYIMVDISKIRIDLTVVPNFVMKVDHTS